MLRQKTMKLNKKIRFLSDSEIEIETEMDQADFMSFFDQALEEMRAELELPGFRKGKVPKKIALEKLGTENILWEAAEKAVKEAYLQVIKEEEIEPISPPKIRITKLAFKNPLGFKLKITILPKIKLPSYPEIIRKIKRKKVAITKREVDEVLDWLRRSRAQMVPQDKPAEKGDFVKIEFFSPQIEKGKKQEDQFILGKSQLVPGFEEKLVGMKKEEQKEFSLVFPKKHFLEELAGKKVHFKVKMISVSKIKYPELNDEFAQKLGKFNSFKELVESIREGIRMEKEIKEKNRLREEIIEKITAACEFEIPQPLIEEEKKKMLEELKQEVKQSLGISFEEYLKRIKKSKEEVINSFSDQAQKRVKRFLVFRQLTKEENITVSEEEITKEMNNFLKQYPSIERVEEDIDIERLRFYTEEKIKTEKTFLSLESYLDEKESKSNENK